MTEPSNQPQYRQIEQALRRYALDVQFEVEGPDVIPSPRDA